MENRVTIENVQPTTNPMFLRYPPQSVPPADTRFQSFRRNAPQMYSTGSAALILVSGGMNIAWSCGLLHIQDFQTDTHIMICWHIAAIIGALVSSFALKRIQKRLIYLFSSVLTLIGGILFLTVYDLYGGIAAARYLNGFAVGLVFVPMMVLIGESVISEKRGEFAALVEMGSFALGIFLQTLFTAAYYDFTPTIYNEFGSTQVHGITVIVCGALSLLLSYFFFIESPVYHLLRNNENEAINCLRRLQHPSVYTHETHQQFDELKRYIDVNERIDSLAVPALLKLCLHRALVSLAFSPLTIIALVLASSVNVGPRDTWPLVIFGLLFWLGTLVPACIMDTVGRKKVLLIGALVFGVMAFVIGGIFFDLINLYSSSQMGIVMYMLFISAFFAGFFSAPSSAYLTEAFPLHLKPFYIAAAFAVQMLVLLIIGVCTFDRDSLEAYYITSGVFYVAFFAAGIVFLPETKQISLRNAQSKFTTLMNGW
ncbi:uncharacterized protein LOC120782455 [Bactrocera tryoni]|uniref:uncharacterized protein LOC120782455 n=1 Tax=Bactrocera tryoni TaxID=59916 RepID=UPI001A964881|nr:uncharacterized protein LOC120782455 [Bactrocera tryoni]